MIVLEIKLKIFVIFLLVCLSSFSQSGSIKGDVQFENGEPVASAIVQIVGKSKGAITDEYGRYEIKDIEYGQYELRISSVEIETKIIQVNLNKSVLKQNIAVQQSTQNLNELIVSGKTEVREIKDKGFAINVIEPRNVEFQSIQTNELLDRTAGVRVRQSGGLGADATYNLNGLSGNSVKIFIDGIPIRNYGPSFSLNSIPPSMIERIEIYKGVVPIYLSDDALGGAINIILKKKIVNNFSVSYSFGSFNTHQADFKGNYRHEKSGFTINASGFLNYSDNNYKVWGENVSVQLAPGAPDTNIVARRFNDRYRSQGVKVDIGFTDRKWADRFFIGVMSSNMDKQIQHGASMKVVYGNRHTKQHSMMYNIEYAKRNILKGLDFNTFASYSQLDRTTVDTIPTHYSWLGHPTYYYNGHEPDVWTLGGGEAGRASLLGDIDQNVNTRSNLRYRINENNSITVNHMFNSFSRESNDPLLPKIENEMREQRSLMKNIVGISFENRAFKQKLRTTVFGKGYFMDRTAVLRTKTGNNVNSTISLLETKLKTENYSFGGAVSYKVVKPLMILVSAERAIRLPEANEIFGLVAANILAAPDLKPERSDNYNLGFELDPDKKIHNIIFRTNLFIRNTHDLILQYNQGGNDQNLVNSNIGKVFTKGVDAEINYSFKKWLIFTANTSFFDAQIHNMTLDPQTGDPVLTSKSRLPNMPFFTMNYNFRIEKQDLFMKGALFVFHYNFLYVHEFARRGTGLGGAGLTTIPTQFSHDSGIAYTFPKVRFTVSFDVKNIFNVQLFDNYALQKPGRAFFMKLTYSIF